MEYLSFFTREPTLSERIWTTVKYPINVFHHPFEALLSLPALSFLVIPAFSSYSTTLNFLFFYMTWAILIRSNPPLQVELIGTLAIRVLFYLLPSACFLAFDSAAPQLAAGLKEHGNHALPMGEKQGGRAGRWWKITLISTANVLFGVLLQTAIDYLFTRVLRIRSTLKITTSLPLPWSIAKDVLLGLLMREVLTYVLHRYALHESTSRLAKWHKSWQHSVLAPFSFVAHYDHPLVYLVHVFLPIYIPAVFFRFHLLTYHLYLTIVSLEETFTFSGYNILPTAFILGGIARRQEQHLMGSGEGNFGCFGLFDAVVGTTLGEDLMDNVVDEANEDKINEKTGKAKWMKKKAPKKRTSDEEEDGNGIEGEEEEAEMPKRRMRSSHQSNGKKSSNEKRSEPDSDEDDKLRKKTAITLKKAKGKPKRRSDDEE
ncbi:MAG: hypothetical protein Q9164_004171 [Protoblastenia rupestris]